MANHGKAGVCIVFGSAKFFVNDPTLLPAVMHEVNKLQVASRQTEQVLGKLGHYSRNIIDEASLLCPGVKSLRDVSYRFRHTLSPSNLHFIRQLNTTYAFARHISEADLQQKLEAISIELSSADCSADGSSTNVNDDSAKSDCDSMHLTEVTNVDTCKDSVNKAPQQFNIADSSDEDICNNELQYSTEKKFADANVGSDLLLLPVTEFKSPVSLADSCTQTSQLCAKECIHVTTQTDMDMEFVGKMVSSLNFASEAMNNLKVNQDNMRHSFDSRLAECHKTITALTTGDNLNTSNRKKGKRR
eukprot:TRINITY_DN30640_c0_g3_i2.p1 TRINITY_DN30640_c0_g3~~TRINITY_DN30640_c0_g3_i2.p1  ORF type:complete len:302 (+),score=58.47 TRINITY_DN30640_c0_g3_i2:126-1031(+)